MDQREKVFGEGKGGADADRPGGNKSAERRLGVGLAQEVEGVL